MNGARDLIRLAERDDGLSRSPAAALEDDAPGGQHRGDHQLDTIGPPGDGQHLGHDAPGATLGPAPSLAVPSS
jgi:hypothetical protein